MNRLKELLDSGNLSVSYYIQTDPGVLDVSESKINLAPSDLLRVGETPIYPPDYLVSGYTRMTGGPLVYGSEDKFIGFAEITKFPREFYPPHGLIFDVDLNLTIHSLESIIYRLLYGEQGGLGVGMFIGQKLTSESLLSLKLSAIDLMNTLSYFGYKGNVLSLDVKQYEYDPTVLVVEIKETYEEMQ